MEHLGHCKISSLLLGSTAEQLVSSAPLPPEPQQIGRLAAGEQFRSQTEVGQRRGQGAEIEQLRSSVQTQVGCERSL